MNVPPEPGESKPLLGSSICWFAAKAAKYGPLQGFLGGTGGGVYRGTVG